MQLEIWRIKLLKENKKINDVWIFNEDNASVGETVVACGLCPGALLSVLWTIMPQSHKMKK